MVAAARGFTEDEQTFKSKYLGDIKTSKNAKDVVKDVGRGLETVSNAIGVGALKTAGANVFRQGVLQVAKRAGVEGLAAGAVQGIGSGVADGKTGKDLLWSAAKSTALGGVVGFVLGGALSKIMGTPKSLDEVAKAKAPYKIPKAGLAPSPTIETPVELKLAENVPTNIGTKGSIPTVSTEIPTLPPDKTITPKGTVVPKVTVGAPQMAPKVEKAKTALRSAYGESPEQLTGGNLDDIAAKSATLIELDKDRALRIALGKEMPRAEDGVTSDAIYRVLSADADGELAVKLANSTVPSTSGIKLATNKLGDRGGIVDTIREANTTLKKNMDPKAAKKAITELAEEIKANKPTLEELKKLIDEFDIC